MLNRDGGVLDIDRKELERRIIREQAKWVATEEERKAEIEELNYQNRKLLNQLLHNLLKETGDK